MLEEAVAARNADIHIIKAQTALGKTEQYAEIVKNWIGKKFIIAVPTIKLQREVAERIEAKGVECENNRRYVYQDCTIRSSGFRGET